MSSSFVYISIFLCVSQIFRKGYEILSHPFEKLFILDYLHQGSRKKIYFPSGPATKAFSPPPWFSGHSNFFHYIKKNIYIFPQWHTPVQPTPVIVARPLRKELFAASLTETRYSIAFLSCSVLVCLIVFMSSCLSVYFFSYLRGPCCTDATVCLNMIIYC